MCVCVVCVVCVWCVVRCACVWGAGGLREGRELEAGAGRREVGLLRLLLRERRAATDVEGARLDADRRRMDPANAQMYGADVPVI